MRFHLLFSYERPGGTSSGDEVVRAESLYDAAKHIARSRGVTKLHVRKRFFSGRPAADAEIINRDFDFEDSAP